MDNSIVGVIMAGGSGERFWPISRRMRPKQLLYLTSEKEMMLEEAVNRLLPLIPKEQIFIATGAHLLESVRKSITNIPPENILGEPAQRNTAGCLAFAVAHILARFGEAAKDMLMSVVTADHLIGDADRFRDSMSAALRFSQEENALLTIGVQPTRPETGYGYIEITNLNQPLSDFQGIPIYNVNRFLEKPSLEDAEIYQASRFYYWNSGMFFWRISTMLNGFKKHMPDHAQGIEGLSELIKTNPGAEDEISNLFDSLPSISIDYGLMEKADNVYVALGDFRWDDVGSWDSLCRFLPRDEKRNASVGDPVMIDCKNIMVYNEPGVDKMAICVIGMENVLVVTSEDGVLVCPKDRAQDVRKAVAEMKKRNLGQL